MPASAPAGFIPRPGSVFRGFGLRPGGAARLELGENAVERMAFLRAPGLHDVVLAPAPQRHDLLINIGALRRQAENGARASAGSVWRVICPAVVRRATAR